MNLLVEGGSISKDTIVGGLHVESEDGAAESAHPGKLVEVLQYDVEGLMTAPRQASHSAVLTVSLRAEVGVDVGNQVV